MSGLWAPISAYLRAGDYAVTLLVNAVLGPVNGSTAEQKMAAPQCCIGASQWQHR